MQLAVFEANRLLFQLSWNGFADIETQGDFLVHSKACPFLSPVVGFQGLRIWVLTGKQSAVYTPLAIYVLPFKPSG